MAVITILAGDDLCLDIVPDQEQVVVPCYPMRRFDFNPPQHWWQNA